MYIYDPLTDNSQCFDNHQGHIRSLCALNNHLYMICKPVGSSQQKIIKYSIKTKTWTPVANVSGSNPGKF